MIASKQLEKQLEKQRVIEGVRVFRENDRVCLAIGNGTNALTAALDAMAARRIGMAILKGAAALTEEGIEGSGPGRKDASQ